MSDLAALWLQDQSVSFAAALLGEEPTQMRADEEFPEVCASVIVENLQGDAAASLSDTTLSLVGSIPTIYTNPAKLVDEEFEGLASRAEDLKAAVARAGREVKRRSKADGTYLNRVLVSHAVYVLKRQRLSAEKFFKWLHRSSGKAVPGADALINRLDSDSSGFAVKLKELLEWSRDPDRQIRDRVDFIDELHELVIDAVGDHAEAVRPWWTRICLGYRNSLFCWPLLEYKNGARGISLPIALFLFPDGKSTHKSKRNDFGQKVWFKAVDSRKSGANTPALKFVPAKGNIPAHMGSSRLGWKADWGHAFQVGVDVAKKLWSAQNGRLKYSDKQEASRRLTSSLNVDMAPACQIVDSVYGRLSQEFFDDQGVEQEYFTVSDRSAEAYWVQAVLGLLLPARDVPLGVVTGRIEYHDEDFEIHDVKGVEAKLEYANRAGFPRVVLPGDRDDYAEDDEASPIKEEVKRFLSNLATQSSRKTMELNFCRTARAAADAMQASGWRRTTFLRLPSLQRPYRFNQRRLFIRDALSKGKAIRPDDREWYNLGKRWTEAETNRMQFLDNLFLSSTDRSVRYVKRSEIFGDAEEVVGQWLAWKDDQVRTGAESGYRGPGLGIMALRTTEHDNEIRLWAAIAELLDVDNDWWDRFHWSTLEQSSEMLAQLLCNQRARISISASSAPDFLVIFDDGRLTQRRTNRIFPTDFNHQFIDLLNGGWKENEVTRGFDRLDAALRRYGPGALGHPTRILVVLDDNEPDGAGRDLELDEDDRRILEKLSVFRFGCSRQSAFSMINYSRKGEAPVSWLDAQDALERLIEEKLLRRNRNTVYLPDNVRKALAGNEFEADPDAHLQAARSLCPILQPSGLFVAANRDRQLEPEAVLEASWHLERAISLVPYRLARAYHTTLKNAQALLTFLRTSPDWDTVKRLRVNRLSRGDAVDLARELVSTERTISRTAPHTSKIGLLLETLGRLYKHERPADRLMNPLADEIADIVEQAVEDIPERISASDRRRRLRFLFSRQIFATRMLEVPVSDGRLAGARSYIENSITEALGSDFLTSLGDEYEGLDDYPLSRDYWICMWNDEKRLDVHEPLNFGQRSTYAYAAARTNLGRVCNGEVLRSPWDQPWVQYFKLTHHGDIFPSQLKSPLETWNAVYGQDEEAAIAFGQRVLSMNAHARGNKPGWITDINQSVANLWAYVSSPSNDPDVSLYGKAAQDALKYIRVVAMQETLPAYCFLEHCGDGWLDRWARDAQKNEQDGWSDLAREVVCSDAGWTHLLSSFANVCDPNRQLARVRSWLFALEAVGRSNLHFSDPENLIRARKLNAARSYIEKSGQAIVEGYQVLALKNDRGWSLFGPLRQKLIQVLSEMDRGRNRWFFALAYARPKRARLAGVRLMIDQCAEEAAVQRIMSPKLAREQAQCMQNVREYARWARPRERETFDRLRETLEVSLR